MSKTASRADAPTITQIVVRQETLPVPCGQAPHAVGAAEAVEKALHRLLAIQREDGHWVFDLEADTTIVSEYILLQRFLGREIDPELKAKMAKYLRGKQMPDGSWPLYEGGMADISASVKAYFALKVAGDSADDPHMVRGRQLILSLGGAAKANVFTRFTLALFGQIPWHTTPAMPIEIMLLPKWFFFHLDKVSYWSRTVIVPLLILYAKRPVCRLNHKEFIPELFVTPPDKLHNIDHFVSGGSLRKNAFILMDRVLKAVDRFIPQYTREKALKTAEKWLVEHMQGEGGIGAIYPAMANAVMALRILGRPEDDPNYQRGLKAVDDLLLDRGDEALCQPCVSPIWDACLSLSAVLEAGQPADSEAVRKCAKWLKEKQILVPGDWCSQAPGVEPGGWAFQYENTLYPDLDDTSMVLMSLVRAGLLTDDNYKDSMAKGVNWVLGLQSSNGGWGSFDKDNSYLYLNDIPFADHGALLDPSTSDLTARCIELLASIGYGKDFKPIARGLEFLRKEQEEDGSWFGRWGSNYIYGTWSVLSALRRVGEDMSKPYVRRAVKWLEEHQNADGGWGETLYSYDNPALAGHGDSTASQTAWSLLALLSAGEVESKAVERGVAYLLETQQPDGLWEETLYTGTGFPRVFYLRYHGYCKYFPVWALGVYRRLKAGEKTLLDQMIPSRPVDFPLPSLNLR